MQIYKMIDGIKINCSYLHPDKWYQNEYLNYLDHSDKKTGEEVIKKQASSFQGLRFVVHESTDIQSPSFMEVAGSIHKYHNKGESNYNDFTHSNITETLTDLKKRFGIDPKKTRLRNLEFGVNIKLPITAQQFLKGVICMPDKAFGQMSIKSPSLGRVCQRAQYSLKIYDKGKQADTTDKDLIRVELHVNKMQYLEKYGIKYLSDLEEKETLLLLGCILISTLNDVVYYNGVFDSVSMSRKDRDRVQKYIAPYRWLEMARNQRYKFRKSMIRFFKKYDHTDFKKVAILEVFKKCNHLINPTQKQGDDFTGFCDAIGADKRVTILPFKCTVRTSPFSSSKRVNKDHTQTADFLKNRVKENGPKICPICGRDITHQKQSSRYCSEKYHGTTARRCRDKAYNVARTKRRKAKREKEKTDLVGLLALANYPGYTLQIVWSVGTDDKTEKNKALVKWQELTAPVIIPVSRVCSVVVIPANGERIAFTTVRAKKLITEILKLNHSQN